MANDEHLAILRQGVEAWNEWRDLKMDVRPDLTGADLTGADLSGAILSGAILSGADLLRTDLFEAHLSGADLTGADLTEAKLALANLYEAKLSGATVIRAHLSEAHLSGADLSGADLTEAELTWTDLSWTDLSGADLSGADLSGADLSGARLVETTIEQASLWRAHVYGVAAWNVRGEPRGQTDLVITPHGGPVVTVDDLEVAQFVYLMMNNEKLKRVIDTITSKVVLILGRFTEERKRVLDALRDELRNRNLTPVLFDFNPSDHQDFTDTVTLLARMARYVIADLTDPRSVQQELSHIAPQVVVAIKPIILAGQEPWSMFGDLRRRSPGLMSPHEYTDLEDLLAGLEPNVLEPLASKREDLRRLPEAD